METYRLIGISKGRDSKVAHATDLVKGRYYVLRIATHAVDGDHLVPDGLHIVAGAEELAKTLPRNGELLLDAALEAYVDGSLLFLELLAKGGNLHEIVRGLEVLANGLRCGYGWCSHCLCCVVVCGGDP